MRPRPDGRGELQFWRPPYYVRSKLQCGHGPMAVENAEWPGEIVVEVGLQCGHGPKAVEKGEDRPAGRRTKAYQIVFQRANGDFGRSGPRPNTPDRVPVPLAQVDKGGRITGRLENRPAAGWAGDRDRNPRAGQRWG